MNPLRSTYNEGFNPIIAGLALRSLLAGEFHELRCDGDGEGDGSGSTESGTQTVPPGGSNPPPDPPPPPPDSGNGD